MRGAQPQGENAGDLARLNALASEVTRELGTVVSAWVTKMSIGDRTLIDVLKRKDVTADEVVRQVAEALPEGLPKKPPEDAVARRIGIQQVDVITGKVGER